MLQDEDIHALIRAFAGIDSGHERGNLLRILAIAFLCMAVAACGLVNTPEEVDEDVIRTAEKEAGLSSANPLNRPQDVVNVHELSTVDENQLADARPTAVPLNDDDGGSGSEAPMSFIFDAHFGAAVASIEERIYLADVIVRATLASTSEGVLIFNAVEYLKGTGPTQFSVSAATGERNAQWDSSEAILFLSTPSSNEDGASGQSTATFEFTDTTTNLNYRDFAPTEYTGELDDGFTIDKANPVWLPSTSSQEESASGTSSTTAEYVAASASTAGDPKPRVTLADLKTKIAWVTGGAGIEGYEECIRWSLASIRYYRDYEVYHGYQWGRGKRDRTGSFGGYKIVDGVFIWDWESGTAAPQFLRAKDKTGARRWGPAYDKYEIRGEHAAFFVSYIIDDDNDSQNGYLLEVATKRPLIAGTYNISMLGYSYRYIPCNYSWPDFRFIEERINVTAPAGTIHEAFFDPIDVGGSVQASETDGVLKPRTFTGGTLNSIGYSDTAVTIGVTPETALDGRIVEVIEIDGTVSLSLDVSDATVNATDDTLSWTVAEAPWADGDELMVRVRAAP